MRGQLRLHGRRRHCGRGTLRRAHDRCARHAAGGRRHRRHRSFGQIVVLPRAGMDSARRHFPTFSNIWAAGAGPACASLHVSARRTRRSSPILETRRSSSARRSRVSLDAQWSVPSSRAPIDPARRHSPPRGKMLAELPRARKLTGCGRDSPRLAGGNPASLTSPTPAHERPHVGRHPRRQGVFSGLPEMRKRARASLRRTGPRSPNALCGFSQVSASIAFSDGQRTPLITAHASVCATRPAPCVMEAALAPVEAGALCLRASETLLNELVVVRTECMPTNAACAWRRRSASSARS